MTGSSASQGAAAPYQAQLRVPPFLLKTLVTAVVGGLAYAVTNLADQPQVWQLTVSIFLGGAALIIQYMIDFERRLDSVEETLSVHNAEMRDLVHEGFTRINEATELFGLIDRSPLQTEKVTKLLLSATQAGAAAQPVMQSFITRQIAGLTDLMEALSRKLVHYEGEDHDWIIALTHCVTKSIDATSTPVDRGFWDSELGQRYLRAQHEAIKERQVRIRRLFIVKNPEDNSPELGQLCDDQQSLGIEVRVLVLSELSPIVRMDETDDFILFDDSMSYEIGADLREVNTRTVMDWRPDRVSRHVQRFRTLWEAAAE
ncbi:MAG: hypothetical protein HOY79_08215 [Streptomyces sp.]|nr:hypothetical protein [Streptomyces sp.]